MYTVLSLFFMIDILIYLLSYYYFMDFYQVKIMLCFTVFIYQIITFMNVGVKTLMLSLTSLSKPINYKYSVHFINGLDNRNLSTVQQTSILQTIKSHQLSHSALIYNSLEVTNKIKSWKNKLPWIQPYYAVKSNPHQYILKDLKNQGSKFDCASRAQIQMVLNIGCKAPHDIVYSNPIKQQSDLIWANQVGIKYTTADTIDQLLKIREFAPDMEVLWRIAIEEEQNYFLSSKFSGKFGDDFQSQDDIHRRMLEIAKLGIKLKGIHFHCGSDHNGASTFGKAVKLARQCLKIGRQYGHTMDLMDIGGGFPDGQLTEKILSDLSLTKNDPLGYQVISEPGRHFSGFSSYLLTRIIGKRVTNNNNEGNKICKNNNNYYLNDSLYHSFKYNILDEPSIKSNTKTNPLFYSSINNSTTHKTIQLTTKKQPSQQYYQQQTQKTINLFGMTTQQNDIIAQNLKVPKTLQLQIGDWICLGGMGAYIYGYHCSFSGMRTLTKVIRWESRGCSSNRHNIHSDGDSDVSGGNTSRTSTIFVSQQF